METLVSELPTGTTNPAPVITCWLPEGERTGSSIVILPGGGYGALAEHEGRGYAEYFAAAGIASFVVTYRLGTDGFRHPAMLEDALAALRAVRARGRVRSRSAAHRHYGIVGRWPFSFTGSGRLAYL